MTGVIPKGKLTAYQRWELAAFDEVERATDHIAPPPPPAPAGTPTVAESPKDAPSDEVIDAAPVIAFPTAEEIERMHDEARAQGYADGRKEGFEEGVRLGKEHGLTEARAVTTRLERLLSDLQQAISVADQQLADHLLALAVEIAGQVLRQSLNVRRDLLLPIVREAIAALHQHAGHPTLFLHPDDASLVRDQLGDQLLHNSWRIIEDHTLTTGGCRVELGASEIDATVETRWRRVIEAIGINLDWLEKTP